VEMYLELMERDPELASIMDVGAMRELAAKRVRTVEEIRG